MSAELPSSELTTEQWEQKLAQLRATNEELQRRRAEAEKDRDLFRELYSKASAHASEVSKENEELTDRAALAESQARDGVAMIRATYQERVRLLEQDVARWKGQCEVLTARDARMNDELRRRAALEPELQAENLRLQEQMYNLETDIRRMEMLLDNFTRPHLNVSGVLAASAAHDVAAA